MRSASLASVSALSCLGFPADFSAVARENVSPCSDGLQCIAGRAFQATSYPQTPSNGAIVRRAMLRPQSVTSACSSLAVSADPGGQWSFPGNVGPGAKLHVPYCACETDHSSPMISLTESALWGARSGRVRHGSGAQTRKHADASHLNFRAALSYLSPLSRNRLRFVTRPAGRDGTCHIRWRS